jgi:hypothetical protein
MAEKMQRSLILDLIRREKKLGISRSLLDQVKPWIVANFAPGTWVWQQDGAPAHTSNLVQKYLADDNWGFWNKLMWPSSTPDLSPLDYSIFDNSKGKACSDPAPDLATLRQRIDAAWGALDATYVRQVCSAFRGRLERVITANGGRIE